MPWGMDIKLSEGVEIEAKWSKGMGIEAKLSEVKGCGW